jgi:hypothetical protein
MNDKAKQPLCRPHCRAGWTQHLLSGAGELPAPLAARVLSAVPAQYLQQIEQSMALRWLPFELHISVLHALRHVLGRRHYHEFCRGQVFASLNNRLLFSKAAGAARRLYGVGPFAAFRAVPPSLRYIFRDAGELRVCVSDTGRELTASYEKFPPAYSQGDTWAVIWSATIEAIAAYMLEGSSLTAHVELTAHHPERGYFEWRATAQ